MKSFKLLLLFKIFFLAGLSAQEGFSNLTNLSPLSIESNTGEGPQSKVWTYAGKYWTVLTNATGTNVFRLDGTNWTNVLNLASGSYAKADIKVVGNVAHIFTWKGNTSYLYSVEYDPSEDSYIRWHLRKSRVVLSLDEGVKTATIDIDGSGRMWLASDENSAIRIRWSSAPFSSWSAPITIATGTKSSDICAVVTMPSLDKIGVFWSNGNTKRFGFRTHNDIDDPNTWSPDEMPGAATALNIGQGFAGNQLNIKATQNGSLYSTIKTNYHTAGFAQVALLLRRPNGTWDAPYPVTFNEGSNPIVVINEAINKIKVIYTLESGIIAYKESPVNTISFGQQFALVNGLYDLATSTKANYSSETVVLVSNNNTAVGVKGIDGEAIPPAGFSFLIPLSRISLSKPTKDKPQAKVWHYANKWWCVMSESEGTKIFRLDGTNWTAVLTLTNKTSKPDCRVAGNLVHILAFRGPDNTSRLYTIEYNAGLNTYELWHLRPNSTNIVFPAGAETATLAVDGKGRMWAASAAISDVNVWWSDSPYTHWSPPITIATGLQDDDMCAITPLPSTGKIGVFWSNQNTKRFGFKTHIDGAVPSSWSLDEFPASQSAIDTVGSGMVDDHMNVKATSDGTLYCSAKTGYDTDGYPKVVLLVRRPSGTWDDLYTVTTHPEGTQPSLLLSQGQDRLKVLYTSDEDSGTIFYRETSLSNISFGPALKLMGDKGKLYNYVTSTHQNYSSEIVIMATDLSVSPEEAVSVLASDAQNWKAAKAGIDLTIQPGILKAIYGSNNNGIIFSTYPNPFSASTSLSFKLPYSGVYHLALFNNSGIKQLIIKKGWAKKGVINTTKLEAGNLAGGLYFAILQTEKSSNVIKLLLQK